MRASWSALHASFIRALSRASAGTAFKAMALAHPDLAGFASIAALMEKQHAPGPDRTARFAVIDALIAAAQSDRDYRSIAQIMVIVALWPGLDAVFWRLARGFPAAREDLAREILSRIGEAILRIDLDQVTAVTATLLRNLERDIRRDLIAERVIAKTLRPIDDPAIATLVDRSMEVMPADALQLADHLDELNPLDALLLKRICTYGETQEEAGRALGLKPDAARKRLQRAVTTIRSRQKIRSPLSHSCSAIGL